MKRLIVFIVIGVIAVILMPKESSNTISAYVTSVEIPDIFKNIALIIFVLVVGGCIVKAKWKKVKKE